MRNAVGIKKQELEQATRTPQRDCAAQTKVETAFSLVYSPRWLAELLFLVLFILDLNVNWSWKDGEA